MQIFVSIEIHILVCACAIKCQMTKDDLLFIGKYSRPDRLFKIKTKTKLETLTREISSMLDASRKLLRVTRMRYPGCDRVPSTSDKTIVREIVGHHL